jgi:hypothetical protein
MNSRRLNEIYEQVGGVIEYARSCEQPLLAPTAPSSISNMLWDEVEDRDLVPRYSPENLVLPPNAVRLNSPSELLFAYESFRAQTHQPPRFRYAVTAMLHESAHLECADDLGYPDAYIGMDVVRSTRNPKRLLAGPYVEPGVPTAPIRKIDEGMLVAAPRYPSPADIACLNAMGYKDRADVLERYKNL